MQRAAPWQTVRPRESSTSDLRTSDALGHGRIRPRKRHGVPMRTPALQMCAPEGRRKLLRAKVLRLAVPDGRGRRVRSDGAGSDPAVRGPATGSGPGAFAHPRPRPLGSLPDQRSLSGKAVRRGGHGTCSRTCRFALWSVLVGGSSSCRLQTRTRAAWCGHPPYERRFRGCRPMNPTMTRSFGSSQAKAMRIVWCGS